jgi:ABC-type phosphate/phosphonate transport system ATPase subunit
VNSKEDFLKEIEDIDKQIMVLKEKKEIVFAEYAAAFCPFKVGEIVEIAGYSYTGKSGVIKQINIYQKNYEKGVHWNVSGNVLNKSGNVGRLTFDFSESVYDRYLEEKRK